MIPFFSKRNQVYPVLWQGRPAVEKHFTEMKDWSQEIALYTVLENMIPLPSVLHKEPGFLVTEYIPQPTFLEVLESQEKTVFASEPWLALSGWMQHCHHLCGQLPSEGNLRNYLWDASGSRVLGLDLECYRPMSLELCGASIVAALLAYEPADTPVKQQAATLLLRELQVSEAALNDAQKRLCEYRQDKRAIPISGIVLAGGVSRRMGTGKAELLLEGRPLLAWQVEKLQTLGISDILLSGKNCLELPGTKIIPDELPDRGPLGGLYSCFRTAENPHCLVLSVDTPLVPCSALAKLCRTHVSGITLLRYKGEAEPLIGVYDKSLDRSILPMISEHGAPVRSLIRQVSCKYFDYLGPAELLLNCNTPQEFSNIQRIAKGRSSLL